MSKFKQVGGFHTKLSKDMNNALYEVSGFHNSFCAACVLNYFGVYNTILEDIFNIGSSVGAKGGKRARWREVKVFKYHPLARYTGCCRLDDVKES